MRKFDSRVTYNAGTKDLRPFVGVLFMIDKMEYFAPLSSPKIKHKSLKNTLDLLKIENGNLGVINFNNMIPVTNKNYVDFDLNEKTIDKEKNLRLNLLKKQLRWIVANRKIIFGKSKLLYNLYNNNVLPINVKRRCCNFPLLEEKCIEYNNYSI